MRTFPGFLALFFALLWTGLARADPVRSAHVTAELVSERLNLQSGKEGEQGNLVAVRLEMDPEWHTYWRFPGDSGLPTEVTWHLPPGWTAGSLLWPLPERILLPPLVNFGFGGEALLAAPFSVPEGTEGEFTVGASVSWLACKAECIPGKAELALRLKVSREAPRAGLLADAFRKLRDQQPRKAPPGLAEEVIYKDNLFGIGFASPPPRPGESIDFFPLAPMLVKGQAPPKVEALRDGFVLWMERADPLDARADALPGLLVRAAGAGAPEVIEVAPALKSLAPAVAPASHWGREALLLVFFAFLGGLVLNLMPCVLPVLGIKVMSLVRQGGGDPRRAARHGQVYGLGVVVSFWVLAGALLALRSAGTAVGWGFQLQQPLFVLALAFLFAFVAADLAGFVRWSGRWLGAGASLASRDGYAGSFFTGALAVVVATPCTAPFMGTAIGAAIAAPAWVMLLVFSSLGLGLALPFMLLCARPALLELLPRPGSWMERLKVFFAFPMAGTVVWLLWVLGQQAGPGATLGAEFGLLGTAMAAWIWRGSSARSWRALAALLVCLSLAVAILASIRPGGASEAADGLWKPYSDIALQEALGAGRPVFVDFTAAWCLTCQVNKKLVLNSEAIQDYLREKGVVLLLADWTKRDPEITRALERHGRIGVPLYLAYRAGHRDPELLPQVLTPDRIRSAFP